MADRETVLIEHKDLPETQKAPVRVAKTSYERLWKGRGWRLHQPKKEGN